MPYRILSDERVEDAVQRIALEQIDRALDEVDDDALDAHETVHQVRKRCKKVRGLIRLVRPRFEETYRAENAGFRDAARTLSDVRDATSRLECFDALVKRYDGSFEPALLAPVRAVLEERREAVTEQQDLGERIDAFAANLAAAKSRVGSWRLERADGFAGVAPGLEKTYRRARKAMERAVADPSEETLHEWRKRVKYHRYHVRLLRETWPPVLKPVRDQVVRLSDLLGDEHDLAIFRRTVLAEREAWDAATAETLLGLIDARRGELQTWAHVLGRRVLAEKPKRHTARHRAYWKAWRAERALEPVLGATSRKVFS